MTPELCAGDVTLQAAPPSDQSEKKGSQPGDAISRCVPIESTDKRHTRVHVFVVAVKVLSISRLKIDGSHHTDMGPIHRVQKIPRLDNIAELNLGEPDN